MKIFDSFQPLFLRKRFIVEVWNNRKYIYHINRSRRIRSKEKFNTKHKNYLKAALSDTDSDTSVNSESKIFSMVGAMQYMVYKTEMGLWDHLWWLAWKLDVFMTIFSMIAWPKWSCYVKDYAQSQYVRNWFFHNLLALYLSLSYAANIFGYLTFVDP